MAQSAAALARLHKALARLETAAARPRAGEPVDVTALRAETERLTKEHAALKDAAERVATRLDGTISRLTGSLRE